MSEPVGIYIEPVAPWSRKKAIAINRGRNLMTMPGSRDVDTGTPVVPIDPSLPVGRVYQPDLHTPPVRTEPGPVKWAQLLVPVGLAGLAGLLAAAVL